MKYGGRGEGRVRGCGRVCEGWGGEGGEAGLKEGRGGGSGGWREGKRGF